MAGVCASVDGMLQGPMGMEDLPDGWRREVKPQTDAVLDEIEAALPGCTVDPVESASR